MKSTWIVSISCFIISTRVSTARHEIDDLSLPPGLKIGAGTSAYQIEGAWNASDKGVNIWDWLTHNNPEVIVDFGNADVTCDSYHKYKEDVRLLKYIGVHHYRFSISWTRMLPNGFVNRISKDGTRYYNNLIDELLANDIEPIVTLYHFDQPQVLEFLGGWSNELMVDWFADYARVVFSEFGDRVKTFVTINEPREVCKKYRDNITRSGKHLLDIGVYLCYTNILKAHAKAWHIYDKEFRPSQGGKVSIANSCDGWVLDETTDAVATDTVFQFECGIITHPIFVNDYPDIVKKRIAMISKAEGFRRSRLPVLSPKWISYIKGTADYFGLNHYTSFISKRDPNESHEKYNSDTGVISSVDRHWHHGSTLGWNVVPEGFGNVLRKIKKEYNNPVVYVLENGYSDYGEMRDYNRVGYHYSYLMELIKAVKRDGCRVQKYTVWSLLDNFEFKSGYTQPYGFVKVDFNSRNKTRKPKLSATWLKNTIRNRKLQDIPRKRNY